MNYIYSNDVTHKYQMTDDEWDNSHVAIGLKAFPLQSSKTDDEMIDSEPQNMD